MANPNYISDGQGERIDQLTDDAGVGHLKLAIGSVAVAGATSTAAWKGVATHKANATYAGTDGLVLVAGLVTGTTGLAPLLVDASGRPIVVGAGVAGTPAGGVLSVQGVASGTPMPVDTELPAAAALADAAANPTSPLVGAALEAFNGATWDRLRTNLDLTVLTSAARTATAQSADLTNINGRGLDLVIDVTAVSGTTPSMTITIQGRDVLSGVYYTILASAAITAIGTYVLHVYPGLTAAANLVANAILPHLWRIDAAITGTTPSFTFSAGASVIL